MDAGLPLGEFTCPIRFEMVRPPQPVVKHEEAVTYVVQGDYEMAFGTTLRFADGKELPIRARLFGENSQKVVVRDADGTPAVLSGYSQGRSEILDAAGGVIFAGRYYDTRTYQALAGDDALTPTGIRISNRTCRFPASGSRTRRHAFAHGWLHPRAVRRTRP
jgi:hypothetical protein